MEDNEEMLEPMSPNAQYFKSSTLSLTILGVLEMEIPVDDSMTLPLLKDLFLPINPRFSSIMVTDQKGKRKWKKVEVMLEDHVHVPNFPSDMTLDYYDKYFTEYLSNLASEPLPQNRPLWEIHILNFPTKNAAQSIIFKLHHSLGDGYSLVGALLSCLERLDDQSLPLSFPTRQLSVKPSARRKTFSRRVTRFFTGLVHTASDFGWSLLKSTLMKDDESPIRSGTEGVEFRPIVTTTASFSIDQLKQIKSKLNVTINDVITGVIMLGIRLYMKEENEGSEKSRSTIVVVMNTRVMRGYKSIDEMMKSDSNTPWGNRIAFLQVAMPKLSESELENPLHFVDEAHDMIKRYKNSATVCLTGLLLSLITKVRGHEVAARYMHNTLSNTSIAMSNLIGPLEKMALAKHPCNGLYFIVAGNPQSLTMTMISYLGKMRIAITVEKGFIDQNKLKSCIENAFEIIYKAALQS